MRCGEEKGCRGNVTGKWGVSKRHIIPTTSVYHKYAMLLY